MSSKLLPHIDPKRCTGCGWCVAVCRPHVLSLQTQGWRKHAVLHDVTGCTACGKCEPRCPHGAIQMVEVQEKHSNRRCRSVFG